MFVQLFRNVSLSTKYSQGKHRKNLCGVPETEEQISSVSKPRQFQNKANQCWADSNKPWQILWSISVPLYDIPTEIIDKGKSFLPGYEVKQSRPTPRLSFITTNLTLKRLINVIAVTLQNNEGDVIHQQAYSIY